MISERRNICEGIFKKQKGLGIKISQAFLFHNDFSNKY